MRTPAAGLPCELVARALVAPSPAKVTERGSELAGRHRTLLLAGLEQASVGKGDALGALR